jgi:hypothetical protein
MLIELRRYAVANGQMHKMHERMSAMLLPLFDEHSIPRPIAIWENQEATSTLTWMVQWPSFEIRQDAWARFAPIFAAARRKEGTPEFVSRTTLTVIAPWPESTFEFHRMPPGCETAWHVQPRIGFGIGFMAACRETAFDRFRSAGVTHVNGCNLLFGALPQALVMLSWPNEVTRADGMAALAKEFIGSTLEEMLLGDETTFGRRGEWEDLDRASYLYHDA